MDSTKDYYMVKYRDEYDEVVFFQKVHHNLIPSLLKILENIEMLETNKGTYRVTGFSFKPSSDYLMMYNILIVQVEGE